MPPDPASDYPIAYGPVYTAIETRLRERYGLLIQAYLGEVVIPEMTAQFDPSMGGAFSFLGGPREKTFAGSVKRGKFLEGKTILQGITFPPKDFQTLLERFRSAKNDRGDVAFHYHPLKPVPAGGTIANIVNKAEQLAYGDLLGLSYDQTTVGLTKATEQRAWGFREIADTYNTAVGPVQLATSYPGENRHILQFGQTPAAYARQVDITSLHIALTPEACNIHIDNVGFVLRGPRSVVGLDPDFIQHIVNELVWKSLLRDWLIGKYGSSSTGVWAVEHMSLMLPSSDTHYAPMAGLKLDLGTAQFTAAFMMGCKCLQSEKITLDERIVPIPSGWSVGAGFSKTF
ncbi:MAG: hypothetical protein JSS22_03420 [Proteobacteria bacterium]|nr:hypothetical protein [Pseudomonadota bacterium]